MHSFTQYLSEGRAWLFIPSAIVLGALHGFEPGHSKTMMAAFIIAIRGTVMQAVLLGLSATASHTALIWVLALVGLHYSHEMNVEKIEPYLQLFTGVVVIAMGTWIFRRAKREERERLEHEAAHARFSNPAPRAPQPKVVEAVAPTPSSLLVGLHDQGHAQDHDHVHGDHHHHHDHGHMHTHSHAPSGLILSGMAASAAPQHRQGNGPHGGMMIDTGHGWLEVFIAQDRLAPRFRVFPCRASGELVPVPKGTNIRIETARLDGSAQKFLFEPKADCWEATAVLPKPHEFLATVTMSHGDHAHHYRLQFRNKEAAVPIESAPHAHPHAELEGLDPGTPEYQDAHERAHAEDLEQRFSNRTVTTWQIVLFGLTGGLMPCPAAFTILLICLQLKQVTLGVGIVLAFSLGLALTMVSVGTLAALSARAATKRFKGLGNFARQMPFASAGLMGLIGLVIAVQGLISITHG
jgi:nickel/cobalt transporter (NicO) family protein